MSAPRRPQTPAVRPPSRRTTSPIMTAWAARLARAADTERAATVEAFWAETAVRTPLVEDVGGDAASGPDEVIVTFLWRAVGDGDVLVTVNRITHDLAQSRMDAVPGTDVRHASFRVGRGWRGSYAILEVDDGLAARIAPMEPRWVMRTVRDEGGADPRNPAREHSHTGKSQSVATMPGAPAEPWLAAAAPIRGTLRAHDAPDGRRVWSYEPVDQADGPRPIVVLLDGEVWCATGHAARQVDALTAAGRIRPPLLLLLDQGPLPQRIEELSIDGPITGYVADRLLPWARERFDVSSDPRDVVISGESLGGLTALRTVIERPEAVGCALSQSASLWQHTFEDLDLTDALAVHVRLHLTVGVHEDVLLAHHRPFIERLGQAGADVAYTEYDGGHDLAWWRGLWAEGILRLLAPR